MQTLTAEQTDECLRIARSLVAHHFRGVHITGQDRDDLVQDAVAAMVKHYDRWDPEKGTLRKWLALKGLGGARDAVREFDTRSRSMRIADATTNPDARFPDERLRRPTSLQADTERDHTNGSQQHGARLVPRSLHVFLDVEDFELHDLVQSAFRTLKDRERYIMDRYYYDAAHMWQIAKELGVTESRVCQIHKECLRKLRPLLAEL